MNVEIVTHELLNASVEELAQALHLVASRSAALRDTVVIDRHGRAVLADVQRGADALADRLEDLAAKQKAALSGDDSR
jgi:hypothetical protein